MFVVPFTDSAQQSEGDGLSQKPPKYRECCQRSVSAAYMAEIKDFFYLSWPIVGFVRLYNVLIMDNSII